MCGAGVSRRCGAGVSRRCGTGVSRRCGAGVSRRCGTGVLRWRGAFEHDRRISQDLSLCYTPHIEELGFGACERPDLPATDRNGEERRRHRVPKVNEAAGPTGSEPTGSTAPSREAIGRLFGSAGGPQAEGFGRELMLPKP